jgi:hypothetical protein
MVPAPARVVPYLLMTLVLAAVILVIDYLTGPLIEFEATINATIRIVVFGAFASLRTASGGHLISPGRSKCCAACCPSAASAGT